MDKPLKELDKQIEGDVLTDSVSRMLYATDASPFQRLPIGVARPRHRQDCVKIINFSTYHKLPIIPRAAGTSLAGQCVGEGLVVDVTRYMNRIAEVDAENRRAKVEPGVIRDDLNHELRHLGLMFAPDPSTSNRCTIAGMVGNNAWGIHSQRYGTTRENTRQAEVVLSDGSVATFGPLHADSLQQKLALQTREGTIYRTVFDIVDGHRSLIQKHFPAPDGIPRNAGYPLDILTQGQPWEPAGPLFNLAPFLCGTEGTLALITTVEVTLVPIPQHRLLLCAHFHSIDKALRSVPQILSYQPAALEVLDRNILERTKENLQQQRNRFWLDGDPAAVLLIEFHGDYLAAAKTTEQAIEELRTKLPAYSFKVVETPQIERVWALRKAGLGLLMGMRSPNKAVTGIEDTAVNVADLPDYVQDVKKVLSLYDTDCVIYGPAGRGNLHLRPKLDLNRETGRRKYRKILDEVTDVVIRFAGTISAKHGDGRLRAYFLERLLGAEILGLLRRVKDAFDPTGILNPNKILDSPPPDQDLRVTLNQIDNDVEGFLDWRNDYGLKAAVQKCNGAGECLKRAGTGTMCPSYMATREEKHSTRGRANIIRQILNGYSPAEALGHEHIKEVLDLCLSCKGCKSECPADVDMARLKTEFLHHYNNQHGIPLRTRVIGHFDRLSRFASVLPRLSNALLAQRWLKTMLGLHPQRELPQFAVQRFSQWWAAHPSACPQNPENNVVLILDPFHEYYEPNAAIAAVSVLERLNFRVTVTPCLSFGRSQISQGLLRDARERIEEAINILYPFAINGSAMVGLEPSEILTLRDEAPDLFKERTMKTKIDRISTQTYLFDEFIALNKKTIDRKTLALSRTPTPILVHGHCHQKSLVGIQPTIDLLSLIPNAEVEIIPSGCCGMAGSFGYEQEHYRISGQIAELVLFPAIRNAPDNSLIIATGTSCRHQISDGLGVRAYHPAEVLAMAMGVKRE